ncbi:MAG: PD-(D/E)XK nuclease family protein [Terrimicrobiaceae bacterium]
MDRRTVICLDRISLPEAVAAHLESVGVDGCWDDLLLVLPTAETGRRVVEAVLKGVPGRVIFPPRLATPLSLVAFGTGEGVATPLQARLAWAGALRSSGNCPLTFGEDSTAESRVALADSFMALSRTLSAGNHDVDSARAAIGTNDPRWDEWAGLAKAYLKILRGCGLKCPAQAQIEAARDFVLPEGICRVLVAGVLDMPPLAWTALRRVEHTIFVHAPGCEDASEAFDSGGTPCVDYWERERIPVSDSQIHVLAGFDEVVATAVRLAVGDASSVAIISGDAGLSNEIVSGLADVGASGFLPEGLPLARHPVCSLAVMLLRLGADADWDDIEALLRHPDFLNWLGRESLWADASFARWLEFGKVALRPGVRELTLRWEALPENATAPLAGIFPAVECLTQISKRLGSGKTARELRSILGEIYGPLDMNRRPGDKDAAKALVSALDEVLAFPSLGDPGAVELASIIESLSGTWHPDKPPGAVEIEGWLELVGENSATVILAGLNEGLLPSRRRVDPLLPDAARGLLGLDHAASRQARDAAILTGAVRVFGERLIVLCGQHGADGTPLKPSRFLLRIPDDILAERVIDLCRELPSTEGATFSDFASLPLQLPRPNRPATAMSVTDFSSYLACPLRFHLSRRLGMRTRTEVSHRLEHDSFGALIHSVLRVFGEDIAMRRSSDAGEIREFVTKVWDSLFEPFGDDVDLLLQREAGRMRLEEFAIQQAGVRRDGWEIRHVEWNIHGAEGLQISGWPLALRGRIDRVEVRGDVVRLIDYKTGALGIGKPDKIVRSRHLRKPVAGSGVPPPFARFGDEVWADLQLPLYAIALNELGLEDLGREISLAYFLLPDDSKKAGVFEWTPGVAELASARECARSIMQEVAEDAVRDWIATGDFQRFAPDPAYDDFKPLALARFLDARALEVVS